MTSERAGTPAGNAGSPTQGRSGRPAVRSVGAADLPLVRRVVDAVAEHRPVVTVVGDVILDRWVVGDAERVSREAPAPVVRARSTVDVPGGAANTAVNLAALGARVRMVALVGDDPSGDALRRLLTDAGVDVDGLVPVPGGRTTTKTRIVGGDRILVRVDEEAPAPDTDAVRALGRAASDALSGVDAVAVCDYGLGLDPAALAPLLVRRRPGTVVVDAHDLTRWAPLRPDLVTPNAAETSAVLRTAAAAAALGPAAGTIDLGHGVGRADAVVAVREALVAATGARHLVVTLDRDGTVVLPDDGTEPVRTRAVPASEQQASGAGDTFTAAATAALAVGTHVVDAARFAQAAADVVVRESGTSTCTADALLAAVRAPAAHVVDHDQLADAVDAARADGRRVVFTNGCFDVVHRGHTTYLRQARELGDLLVVAVNDDDSVRRLKGPERPINPAEDRAGVLAALGCVDLVTVFATDTPIPLIERVRPDVYVKGGDYAPDMLAETAVVRGYGGDVVMVDYVAEHSTTEVVRRIRAASS